MRDNLIWTSEFSIIFFRSTFLFESNEIANNSFLKHFQHLRHGLFHFPLIHDCENSPNGERLPIIDVPTSLTPATGRHKSIPAEENNLP